jgi:tryptophan-rich hypothetical protein
MFPPDTPTPRLAAKSALSPKKLLLSKWTAVAPLHKEKHFMVVRVVDAEPPSALTRQVELEAVHSKRCVLLHWRELTKAEAWQRGWV